MKSLTISLKYFDRNISLSVEMGENGQNLTFLDTLFQALDESKKSNKIVVSRTPTRRSARRHLCRFWGVNVQKISISDDVIPVST